MHDLARVLYESLTASLGIKTQLKGTVTTTGALVLHDGAMSWDDAPPYTRARYRQAAEDLLRAHGENAIEHDRVVASNAPRPVVAKPNASSETFTCNVCGASLMKGENHDC